MAAEWQGGQKIDYEDLGQARESFHTAATNGVTNGAADSLAEADPELEAQLFVQRGSGAGTSLSALELNVTVEGPTQVDPVTKVPLLP